MKPVAGSDKFWNLFSKSKCCSCINKKINYIHFGLDDQTKKKFGKAYMILFKECL